MLVDDAVSKYFSLSPSIVCPLKKSLQGNYHQFVTDNYFSTASQTDYLLQHQAYCCGKIRSVNNILTQEFEKQ